MRRPSEGRLAAEERWARADEAPRLSTEVPELRQLKLVLSEWRGTSEISGTAHTRLFVIDTAPAVFVIPCGDTRCRDGGHELTYPIMRGLADRQKRLEGEDECRGNVGSGVCDRTLRFVLTATYE
jgi:hypothetical protein